MIPYCGDYSWKRDSTIDVVGAESGLAARAYISTLRKSQAMASLPYGAPPYAGQSELLDSAHLGCTHQFFLCVKSGYISKVTLWKVWHGYAMMASCTPDIK